MSLDRKDNDGKPDREAEFTAFAKKYQASDEVTKSNLLLDLIENKKDEDLLIWLHKNKIIDLHGHFTSGGRYNKKGHILYYSILTNLLKFVEYVCQMLQMLLSPTRRKFIEWNLLSRMIPILRESRLYRTRCRK